MNRDQKSAVIAEVTEQISSAEAIFAVDYRGLSVAQAAQLRAQLREVDASFRVLKNSLTERAADQAGAELLKQYLEGPTAMTFVRGDIALAAKTLAEFSKAEEILSFKGGSLNGAVLTAEGIQSLAKLPSRQVLYGQLVGMVASPLTGLATGLNGLIAGLGRQLQQIADQGLVGGSTSPDAAPAVEAQPATSPEDGATSANDSEAAPSVSATATEGAEQLETPESNEPSAPSESNESSTSTSTPADESAQSSKET